MNLIQRFCLALWVMLLAACAQPAPDANQALEINLTEPLDFKQKSFELKGSACEDAEESTELPCMRIKVSWPSAVEGREEIQDEVNILLQQHINNYLSSYAPESAEMPEDFDPYGYAQRLLVAWEEELSPMRSSPEWSIDIQGEIVRKSPEVVTVKFDQYAYTGGAHPNTYVSYFNFDPASGRRLSFGDLVKDSLAVVRLGEQYFRKMKSLAPDASLNEEGYSFPGDQFVVSNEVTLTDSGLLLFYNSYEIAPYAVGQTQVQIPYDQLDTLLRRR